MLFSFSFCSESINKDGDKHSAGTMVYYHDDINSSPYTYSDHCLLHQEK